MPLFIRRPSNPEIVEAEQVGAGGHTHPGQGQRPPRPGDWVVTNHSTGQTLVMTNDEFQARYTPAPIPSHMLAPPGGGPPQPTAPSAGPQAEPPAETPQGPEELFSPSGPSTPMNEGIPGRPVPSPEVRPRLQEPAPIESPTGLVEQPGEADKAYHGGEPYPAEESPPPVQGPDDINAPVEETPPPPLV